MSDYQTRLAQALAETDSAGISRYSSFPLLLRGLTGLGLRVRPLHFMSTVGLVLFLTAGLSAVILSFHGLAVLIEVDASRGALRHLQDLGVSGSVAFGVLAGLLTAIIIRYQALRADLPAWRDL